MFSVGMACYTVACFLLFLLLKYCQHCLLMKLIVLSTAAIVYKITHLLCLINIKKLYAILSLEEPTGINH